MLNFWKEIMFAKSPYKKFTDYLVKTHTKVFVASASGFYAKTNKAKQRRKSYYMHMYILLHACRKKKQKLNVF